MNKCKFDIDWIGRCNKDCVGEYCEHHENLKCSVCGNQSTHSCDNTFGQFVCGAILCDSCTCHCMKNSEISYNILKNKTMQYNIEKENI